ncbi:MAG: LysM peptidoglycan-binding domain-containing protein [Planctomycetes bacterium]|nr:LysM peptidoglycan-binding domain-containing protein [Planctomycetota bacterium]MCB9910315.1 LysM peptidoglycan-binding domain-containing protein [Planctomycetota bacterium]MCB9912074.1 LysM peptidoglycan-binding domain-containing protein [Planctomycetota bacterium]HPF14717.1 LysM domain-containing protein [Planctomycetota bacterium]HRV82585.1 LysM domain-containing protein [Planctomycetota bacterium]
MRVFLGLSVLLSLFLMAAFWQKGITRRLEQKREYEQGISFQGSAGQDRWVKLVLGRPSGAEPMATPIHLQGPSDVLPPEDEPQRPPPAPDIEPDVTHVVKAGEVLGTICMQRYGNAKPKVLTAVAVYNDLKNPNVLKQGQVLALPSLEVLFPEER